MYVTGGSKKGMKLKTPEGYEITRPATSKLKKAIFDLIGADIIGSRTLDLYAGTGALSIEALSRGAAESILVDLSNEAIEIINFNITKTDFNDKVKIIQEDIYKVVETLIDNEEKFNYIFVDPPYDAIPDENFFIQLLEILDDDGAIFVESRLKTEFLREDNPLYIYETRRYGKTKLTIIVKRL